MRKVRKGVGVGGGCLGGRAQYESCKGCGRTATVGL